MLGREGEQPSGPPAEEQALQAPQAHTGMPEIWGFPSSTLSENNPPQKKVVEITKYCSIALREVWFDPSLHLELTGFSRMVFLLSFAYFSFNNTLWQTGKICIYTSTFIFSCFLSKKSKIGSERSFSPFLSLLCAETRARTPFTLAAAPSLTSSHWSLRELQTKP